MAAQRVEPCLAGARPVGGAGGGAFAQEAGEGHAEGGVQAVLGSAGGAQGVGEQVDAASVVASAFGGVGGLEAEDGVGVGEGSGEAEGSVAAGGGEAVGLGEGGAGFLGADRVLHDGRVEQCGDAEGAEGGGPFGDRHVGGGGVRGGRGGPFAAGHGGAHRPCGLQELERLRAAAVVLGEGGDERGEFVEVAVGGGLVATQAEFLLHGFGEPLDLAEGPHPGREAGVLPDVLPEGAGGVEVVPAAPDPAAVAEDLYAQVVQVGTFLLPRLAARGQFVQGPGGGVQVVHGGVEVLSCAVQVERVEREGEDAVGAAAPARVVGRGVRLGLDAGEELPDEFRGDPGAGRVDRGPQGQVAEGHFGAGAARGQGAPAGQFALHELVAGPGVGQRLPHPGDEVGEGGRRVEGQVAIGDRLAEASQHTAFPGLRQGGVVGVLRVELAVSDEYFTAEGADGGREGQRTGVLGPRRAVRRGGEEVAYAESDVVQPGDGPVTLVPGELVTGEEGGRGDGQPVALGLPVAQRPPEYGDALVHGRPVGAAAARLGEHLAEDGELEPGVGAVRGAVEGGPHVGFGRLGLGGVAGDAPEPDVELGRVGGRVAGPGLGRGGVPGRAGEVFLAEVTHLVGGGA
ncbi:hypothetical protein [Streptomyces koyangensis]|uniref:hypothetical protein n=1 Tax=Streptomyces koyangensis TaxID=188770 RepID=UPI001CECD37B|nr:hypothetical protein [Streptomyces koyangensis]